MILMHNVMNVYTYFAYFSLLVQNISHKDISIELLHVTTKSKHISALEQALRTMAIQQSHDKSHKSRNVLKYSAKDGTLLWNAFSRVRGDRQFPST